MYHALVSLVNRLDEPDLEALTVIPWGCPVPSFGDVSTARVATLGLNPSNREFVDSLGNELMESARRLHTLRSLGLRVWGDAEASHLIRILDACRGYFLTNPYDTWFRRLDAVLHGIGASFYGGLAPACHLDLVPYATSTKWMDLTAAQRDGLLSVAADVLGRLVRDSPIAVLILNGRSVVRNLEVIAQVALEEARMSEWGLPRNNTKVVAGVAYFGAIHRIGGVSLGRDVLVLGYNHNLQSSFGVTANVVRSIRDWIRGRVREKLQ